MTTHRTAVVLARVALAGLSLAGMAACSRYPAIPVSVETVTQVSTLAGPTPNKAGMVLVIRPHTADGCNGAGNYVATVAWRVTGTPANPITVRITTTAGPIFAIANGVTGQAETGPWVHSALAFYLVDGRGSVLASASATGGPC